MCTACVAQEPFLLVGPPGTAKSELVTKFCQALGLADGEYFEYMLTKFTEPSELLGPVDIAQLKEGRYVRKVEMKLPTAKVAFLDEIFKSNSAILNTLLTIINERKTYQDGRPVPVNLVMLFAATNRVPEFEELAALRDRFALKAESSSVKDQHFEELLEKGVSHELDKALNRRPWEGICTLDDFVKLKRYLDCVMAGVAEGASRADPEGSAGPVARDRKRYFPDDVYDLFKRIIRTLEREDRIVVSDRKVVKLYRLVRARAFLFHGGAVRKEDLILLRYIGDRSEDFGALKEKVDALLRLS
jgi:MoxR-like ATPase